MPRYHLLIDFRTRVVLCLSAYAPTIVFLNEFMKDTESEFDIQVPNYPKSLPILSEPPTKWPEWTWHFGHRKFLKTKPEVLTDAMRAISALAVAKHFAISDIMYGVSRIRNQVDTGVALQETVYRSKKEQAEAFRKADYSENVILEVPYVVQYADFANLSLKQAANDILFKWKLDEDLLAKTELLRLRYFNRVRSAVTEQELNSIVKEFHLDCNSKQLV